MRSGLKVLALLGIVAAGWIYFANRPNKTTVVTDGFTFRLTSLTKPPVHVQHGMETYITLNMIEAGGTEAVRIDDPPSFPLTATLEYQTVDGQKRKVSSSYGYRC